MQYMELHPRIAVTTEPVGFPAVSVAEAKLHCRLPSDVTNEDDLLTLFIMAAAKLLESHAEVALVQQTRTLYLDDFPCDALRLEVTPIQSLTVKYYNTDGTLTTVDAADYNTFLQGGPGLIYPKQATPWPTDVMVNKPGAVEVAMVCGYTAANLIPPLAKFGILCLIGHWYRNREAVGKVASELELMWQSVVSSLQWRGHP